MRRNLIETVMGAVVLVVAGFFLVFAYTTANVGTVSGYEVRAEFDRVDGLASGSEVRMAGIKIGTVLSQTLDPRSYLAVVTMSVDPSVKLPLDTSAKITADSLLGDKYLSLTPGAEDENIPAGGRIETTQGSIDLMDLIGRLIFSQTGGGEKKSE